MRGETKDSATDSASCGEIARRGKRELRAKLSRDRMSLASPPVTGERFHADANEASRRPKGDNHRV